MSSRKILFLDRDGTLIEEPADFQIDSPEKFALVPGVISGLRELKNAGYEFVLVSNQDGLGSTGYPQRSFDLIQSLLLGILGSEGIHFSSVRICPHLPIDRCACRKPQTTLVQDFLRSDDWNRKSSAVIGDRQTDLDLAANLGVSGILIGKQNGWKKIVADLRSGSRRARVVRKTAETSIEVEVDLDCPGDATISTGIGIFDHLLGQIARHGAIGLSVRAQGDLHIDDHHTVEDVGLALGSALSQALGEKQGIGRYGFCLPMDETRAEVLLDLGGRPFFRFEGKFHRELVGGFATEMVPHFFRSVSDSLRANIHLKVDGENTHHEIEGLFKAFARCLRQAVAQNGRTEIPSTKGVL